MKRCPPIPLCVVRRLAAAAVALALLAAPAGAMPLRMPAPTIVVHVNDYAQVPPGQLLEAQRVVADVYGQAGVRVVWRGGSAALAARNQATGADAHALHIDAIILSKSMIASSRDAGDVLGRADGVSRRAYILHPRIVDYAVTHETLISRVLAYVLAHEIGHVVLPSAHAPAGLMEQTLRGRALLLPSFSTAQATALRASLLPPTLLSRADSSPTPLPGQQQAAPDLAATN